MSYLADPLNLILLAVAVIVFWRLRHVLGSRTGTERPPFDPRIGTSQEGPPSGIKASEDSSLPPGRQRQSGAESPGTPAGEETPIWQGFADQGTPLAIAFEQLVAADRGFSPRAFVEGAKVAYEMIIEAFAKGDRSALKGLLSREVYEGFSKAIDARASAGHRLESRFVGIDKVEIVAAEAAGSRATITVRFVSELISATLGADGAVIEGDPRQVRTITDVWTFEREVASTDPNWKLVATEAPA